MNRMVLWLANALLLLLAFVVTAWVVGQSPGAAPAGTKDDSKPPRAERRADRKGTAEEPDEVDPQQGTTSAEDAEVLWQQTLFRPERTENITQPPAEDAAAGAVPSDLELVGLARIGGRTVAVIVHNRGQPRRSPPGSLGGTPPGTAPLRRPVGPRLATPSPAIAAAETAAEGPPDRHVYKVGDKIGDSGYSLKEIRLKEREAVLVRGGEERVLKLDATDEQSSSRRETAAAQAAPPPAKPAEVPPPQPGAVRPPGEAGAAAAPVPLPPPPVAAGVAGTSTPAAPPGQVVPGSDGTGGIPLSREERLSRARLLRERILQGRAPANTTN